MTPQSLIAFCLCPVMAVADVGDFRGTWCPQGDGPLLFIEDSGMGLGDHMICDWKRPPLVATDGLTGVLTCRNVYVTGENADGTVSVIETDHLRGVAFIGEVTRTDRFGARYLEVSLDGEYVHAEFGPCG